MVRYANRLVQLGRRLSVLQLGDEHHAHVAHLGKLSLGVSEPLASLANRCSKVLRVPNSHSRPCSLYYLDRDNTTTISRDYCERDNLSGFPSDYRDRDNHL